MNSKCFLKTNFTIRKLVKHCTISIYIVNCITVDVCYAIVIPPSPKKGRNLKGVGSIGLTEQSEFQNITQFEKMLRSHLNVFHCRLLKLVSDSKGNNEADSFDLCPHPSIKNALPVVLCVQYSPSLSLFVVQLPNLIPKSFLSCSTFYVNFHHRTSLK